MGSKKSMNRENSYIVISDKVPGLPFSKGIMAPSIMATGMSPEVAYNIAALIEDHLRKNDITSITVKRLRETTFNILKMRLGEDIAERYMRWHSMGNIGKPLIILIGGATGVGKSTIAAQLSNRLNINRIIPTDAIREVMRASVSPKLIPPLRGSCYNAWQNLNYPLPPGDPVILGYREQTQAVVVGVEGVMNRAIEEGTNVIIEGAHIAPGYMDIAEFSRAIVIQMIIQVKDLQMHKDHFLIRNIATRGSRPYLKYIENMDNIRKIQDYLIELAAKYSVRVIDSYNLDDTVLEVLDLINEKLKQEFDEFNRQSKVITLKG